MGTRRRRARRRGVRRETVKTELDLWVSHRWCVVGVRCGELEIMERWSIERAVDGEFGGDDGGVDVRHDEKVHGFVRHVPGWDLGVWWRVYVGVLREDFINQRREPAEGVQDGLM